MAEKTRAALGREAAGIAADSGGGAGPRWRPRGEVRGVAGPRGRRPSRGRGAVWLRFWRGWTPTSLAARRCDSGEPRRLPGAACPRAALGLRKAVPVSATPSLLAAVRCSAARPGRALEPLAPARCAGLCPLWGWPVLPGGLAYRWLWARAIAACDLPGSTAYPRRLGSRGLALALALGVTREPSVLCGSWRKPAGSRLSQGPGRTRGAPCHRGLKAGHCQNVDHWYPSPRR